MEDRDREAFKMWVKATNEYSSEAASRAAEVYATAEKFAPFDPEVARLMRVHADSTMAVFDYVRNRTEGR